MSNLYEDDYYLVVNNEDDGEPESAVEKYGMWLYVWLFFGIIVCSGIFVVVLVYISRIQEAAKRKAAIAEKEEEVDRLTRNLTCKPWAPGPDDTGETVASVYTAATNGSESDTSCNGVGGEDDDDDDVEQGDCKRSYSSKEGGNSCAICGEDYQSGQAVYVSNNPQCSHEFHTKCMNKWLACQNSCPVCNLPFSLCLSKHPPPSSSKLAWTKKKTIKDDPDKLEDSC